MAFNNGANDVSNAFSSAVGSGAVRMRIALGLASVFTFLGAIFFGGKVALNLVEGFVDAAHFPDAEHYALAMLAVLFSSGLFVLFSTLTSLPVSCTHSIVGGLLGVNLVLFGLEGINWHTLGMIALSWILSPICAGFVTYFIVKGLYRFILMAKWPLMKQRLQYYLPIVLGGFLTGIIFMLLYQQEVISSLSDIQCGWVCIFIYLFISLVLYFLILYWQKGYKKKNNLGVMNVFKKLQIGAACAVAFGNGANDVSNSISPLLAVFWILTYGHFVGTVVPLWILCVGGVGIVCGILTLGHRVMETLGRKITTLTPDRGFVIDLSVAMIVLVASCLGLPISTTHATTGSIIGAGIGKTGGGVRFGILAKIFLAWVLTVPFAALITICIYQFFNWGVSLWIVDWI